MTLGAGLVLAGCGDDATTTPAPAPPPPPPPAPEPEPEPEPMAPATPTGLHVDETTENSITWHWNAVEGATGYVVQASMDEEFDDTDTVLFDGVPFTTEDHYTATDLEPETTVYVRVRAAAGTADAPLLSDWSEPSMGMSAMPPPVPTPFMVEFSLPEDAKSMYPMIPDKDNKDKETATAMVNTQMTVTVNMNAIVQPLFVEDASPVGLVMGEQWPFAYVNWNALQSMVVDTGAQFLVTPVVLGANQMPTPIGDGTIVTCGPFACATGEIAPEIGIADSATCESWMASLEIDVGLIDNDQLSHYGTAFYDASGDADVDDNVVAVRVFDGLDLGWTYMSSEKIKAKHDLSVVDDQSGTIDKSSSATELPRMSIGRIALGTVAGTAQEQVYYAMSAEPDETGRFVDPDTGTTRDVGSCQPVSGTATAISFDQDGAHYHANSTDATDAATAADEIWGYNDNVSSRVSQPEECFRLTVDDGIERNYLDPYEVTLTLAAADLSWGPITWDAFEDISCDGKMFTPDLDVCEMLAEDVDMLPDPMAMPVVTVDDPYDNIPTSIDVDGSPNADVFDITLAGFNLTYPDAADGRHRFTAMWYQDRTQKKPADNLLNLYTDSDLNVDVTAGDQDSTDYVAGATSRADVAQLFSGAMFDMAGVVANSSVVWVPTIDKDFDPIYGDLGKASVDGDDMADNFVATDDSAACTADDGGSAATGRNGADNNSTLCDAMGVEIPASVSFVDGLGLGCDPVKVEYTITCDWSSRGNVKGSVGGNQTDLTAANLGKYLDCEVEKN